MKDSIVEEVAVSLWEKDYEIRTGMTVSVKEWEGVENKEYYRKMASVAIGTTLRVMRLDEEVEEYIH